MPIDPAVTRAILETDPIGRFSKGGGNVLENLLMQERLKQQRIGTQQLQAQPGLEQAKVQREFGLELGKLGLKEKEIGLNEREIERKIRSDTAKIQSDILAKYIDTFTTTGNLDDAKKVYNSLAKGTPLENIPPPNLTIKGDDIEIDIGKYKVSGNQKKIREFIKMQGAKPEMFSDPANLPLLIDAAADMGISLTKIKEPKPLVEQKFFPEKRRETKFAETIGTGLAEEYLDVRNARRTATQKIFDLRFIESLLDEITTGRFGKKTLKLRGFLKDITGIDIGNVGKQEAFEAVSHKFALDMAEFLKGAISDKDMEILQDSVTNVGKTKEANKLFIKRAKLAYRRQIEAAKFLDKLRKRDKGPKDEHLNELAEHFADKDLFEEFKPTIPKKVKEKVREKKKDWSQYKFDGQTPERVVKDPDGNTWGELPDGRWVNVNTGVYR